MTVADLMQKLKALPSAAEVCSAADYDHSAFVWVEVDGEDVYLIEPKNVP